MDNALDDAEQQLIEALISSGSAWQTPAELSDRLHWTSDRTLDVVADLDGAGWLDAWELADGPAVTLSVMATDRLGVRLVEVGVGETLRWARAGELDPVARRAGAVFRSERMASLDLVADARPGAEQALIREEEAEQAALIARGGRPTSDEGSFARPVLLIGTGLTPWPGPAEATGSACPACRSTPLPSHAYCIRCDRSGRDATGPAPGLGEVPAAPATAAGAGPTPAGVARDESRRREKARRRRQEKRRRRRAAQAKLGRPVSRIVVPLWMAHAAG